MAQPLIPRFLLAVVAGCAASVSQAAEWRGDEHTGSLQFTATQAGAKFTSAFGRFQVRFDFDEAKPAAGRLDVTVETTSVDTADVDRDEILRSRDFFWCEQYPEAVFHAGKFERDGAGWRASGELTLRGLTRPVFVRFELAPGPMQLVMKGAAGLRRLEFGVGQGEWTSTEWVGDEVGVVFDLKLLPAALPDRVP
ncbi:MAG: YceI family protein [Steroidobacteraceae bacterium]